MNRSLHIMTTTPLIFATLLGTGCSKWSASEATPPAVSNEQSSLGENAKTSQSPVVNVEPAISKQPTEFSQLSESDLVRSSWENPFHPRLWNCDGWRMDENSMATTSESPPPATFLRPYRNVVVECRFGTTAAVAASSNESSVECEIRLLNQSTQQWTSLSVNSNRVTLAETRGKSPALRTLRETARSDTGDNSKVDVRLTLTPNRILVAVDGQMKININRPGSIMMADCLAQFVVAKADLELSELRFEGD